MSEKYDDDYEGEDGSTQLDLRDDDFFNNPPNKDLVIFSNTLFCISLLFASHIIHC